VAEQSEELICIHQIRSGIGRPAKHRRTLRAMGLRKHQQSVIQRDTPAIRGMIRQVRHLVSVAPVDPGPGEAGP